MSNQQALVIPADHPAFAGHFPGAPIVPGVVLLDAVIHFIGTQTGLTAKAWHINSVKFLSPLTPGEPALISYTQSANQAIQFSVQSNERQIVLGSLGLSATTGAA